ncbi:hypothetical protein [Staphylococcus auricularis]|uniref:hypothetical protein n=1 Tax=Staphylococcus auricularis TaxID=29379 RepID=UPI0019326645|nr:hypothetical protein [Staphylococcus auricularis]MBM0868721.1 hypothetical protein [Staphylococcus auricularis]MCG7340770.1 hypothetical protein [Staphylococcus auricularis]
MTILYIILIGLAFALVSTGSKWLDGKIIQKKTDKSSKSLKNDKKSIIITFILFFIVGIVMGCLIFI